MNKNPDMLPEICWYWILEQIKGASIQLWFNSPATFCQTESRFSKNASSHLSSFQNPWTPPPPTALFHFRLLLFIETDWHLLTFVCYLMWVSLLQLFFDFSAALHLQRPRSAPSEGSVLDSASAEVQSKSFPLTCNGSILPKVTLKGALCSFGEKIQAQNLNIYNNIEVMKKVTKGGRVRHI